MNLSLNHPCGVEQYNYEMTFSKERNNHSSKGFGCYSRKSFIDL